MAGLRLFRLFGFTVRIDASWIVIALLVTWSLATGYFPDQFQDLPPSQYWWMGVIGALGLFISIVFHEFCHSLVARLYGLPMKGITLFLFGGVAEMEREPESPKSEFLMAAAGPLSSFLLAGVVFLAALGSERLGWPSQLTGVLAYLAWINLALAVFNLVPAFPLDGGRILRSALWAWKRDLGRATAIAAGCGSAFGVFLILLGAASFLAGYPVGGMWYVILGLFLRGAAKAARRRQAGGSDG